jgi:hypothetical protein
MMGFALNSRKRSRKTNPITEETEKLPIDLLSTDRRKGNAIRSVSHTHKLSRGEEQKAENILFSMDVT